MNIESDFMLKKYQELKKINDIIFIKESDISKFDIIEFNKRYQDARAFQINYHGKILIFIKEIKIIKGLNYREISRRADVAYQNRDNETAIKLYETILLEKKPSVHVYARLGILYLSEDNIPKSLRYLTIATGLSAHKAHKKYDFSRLISKLLRKEQTIKFSKKLKVSYKMDTSDFKNDLEEFSYFTRIKEVILLMEFQGMNVEETCTALKIDEEEKNIIALYLARDCYARNDFIYGNTLFKIAEKSKDKSDKVKKLIQEIKANRLFYNNRVTESYKPLLRTRLLK